MEREIHISGNGYYKTALEADDLPYVTVNFLHLHPGASRETDWFT
jgi:hypothetical protein